jgi:hypothetical protein
MRALLVYESMFGNTQEIARAVAAGLATRMSVDLVEVGTAGNRIPDDIDLLVVGAPTHALGLSKPQTRLQAGEKANVSLVSTGNGLREWLDIVGPRADGLAAAAFDTRVKLPIPGSASRSAARQLRHRGYRLISRPTNFYVAGTTGPLLDGELHRAREWGVRLAGIAAGASADQPRQPTPAPPTSRPGPASDA